jgi:epoxyqueuosine reductase
MAFKEAIKAEAQRLGFQLVGVTSPDPPEHIGVFESWLDLGRHGEMGYLATERSRQRRADPRQILPECRSILVLGMRYPKPGSHSLDREIPDKGVKAKISGRMASYAWGDDYHEILPERLAALVGFIEKLSGAPVPSRWYTDTGPLLERDLAQRAGLGWIGKNTCLIHPGLGSYFLLAEILLGIEIEPDPPVTTDYCGSCTRCLDACPTACILPDRTIDARRCISYLTIELKGAIPPELRSQTGEWVFGCDICQEVCPWNIRFAEAAVQGAAHIGAHGAVADDGFAPRLELAEPDLIDELSISAADFNRKFKGSPVKRAKRRGYLRNVAVALANRAPGTPYRMEAVHALITALSNDPEALVRRHAAWALARIGGRTAQRALQQALHQEKGADVLSEIHQALEAIPDGDGK